MYFCQKFVICCHNYEEISFYPIATNAFYFL